MVKRQAAKIGEKIKKLKNRYGFKWQIGVGLSAAFLVAAAAWLIFLPLPQNYETEIPLRPKSHSAKIISCDCEQKTGAAIEIKFHPDQPALISLPGYKIEETAAEAKTRVIFENISRVQSDLDWRQIDANPLIDFVRYKINDGQLILDIWRKGPYAAAKIETNENLAKIILPQARENYPIISASVAKTILL